MLIRPGWERFCEVMVSLMSPGSWNLAGTEYIYKQPVQRRPTGMTAHMASSIYSSGSGTGQHYDIHIHHRRKTNLHCGPHRSPLVKDTMHRHLGHIRDHEFVERTFRGFHHARKGYEGMGAGMGRSFIQFWSNHSILSDTR